MDEIRSQALSIYLEVGRSPAYIGRMKEGLSSGGWFKKNGHRTEVPADTL